MKIIKTMVDQIKHELEGAKEYAIMATELKTDNPAAAQTYFKMAQDELNHATLIHAEAVKAIDRHRAVKEPPAIMKELWSIEHKYYMEHAAATKAMLDLYAK